MSRFHTSASRSSQGVDHYHPGAANVQTTLGKRTQVEKRECVLLQCVSQTISGPLLSLEGIEYARNI
jgi:hypothetical protein